MFATIVAVVLVFLFHYYLQLLPSDLTSIWMGAGGAIFIVATCYLRSSSLMALQKASRHVSSQVLVLAKRDVALGICRLIWVGFILFSFAGALFVLPHLFIYWLIFLGITIDATHTYISSVARLVDPTTLLEQLEKEAGRYFGPLKQTELSHTIDEIAEVGAKGVKSIAVPVANQAITTLAKIGEEYEKDPTRGEAIVYILGFIMHRLQMIYSAAAIDRIEPIANQVILSTTKLVLAGAKENATIASLPIHFLTCFIEQAEEHQLSEVFTNGPIILFELAKSLVAHPDLKGKEVSALLFALIDQLNEMGKEEFQRNKKTPISAIRQPFQDLKELIKQKGSFPNSLAVVARLDRIILEYSELEKVLSEIPNIPGYSTKSTS